MQTIQQAFYFYVVIQNSLLGMLLLRKQMPPYNSTYNIWLSAYFFGTAFNALFQNLIRNTDYINELPQWVFLYDFINLLNLVFLLLFVSALAQKKCTPLQKACFLLPALCYAAFVLGNYAVQPWATVRAFYSTNIYFASVVFIGIILVAGYALGLILLQKTWQNAHESTHNFSNLELLKIRWVQLFLCYLLFKTILGLGFGVFQARHHHFAWIAQVQQWYVAIMYALQITLLLTITYLMLRQSGASGLINTNIATEPTLENQLITAILPKKQAAPLLNTHQIEDLRQRLDDLVQTQKIYLDADVSLVILAQKLHTPMRTLSWLINEKYQQNFNDYINTFRINEAKKMLINPQTALKTNYAIAIDAGFSSESSFYAIFKKHTGTTPNQMRIK